jgi:hypothetical protein
MALILAAGLYAMSPVYADPAPSKAAGEWQSLFNGKDLNGWRLYGKQQPPGAGWTVENGVLQKIGGVRGGDIITEDTFDDFEFSWEWRIGPRGNNGIKYLVTERRPSAPGHEYQLLDDTGHPDGNVGPKRQTASFYDVLPPVANKPMRAIGEWNSSKIVVRGAQVEHWLNGEKVLAYELGSPQVQEALAASKFKDAPGFGEKITGHLMLTDHQDECWFRNLKVRRL